MSPPPIHRACVCAHAARPSAPHHQVKAEERLTQALEAEHRLLSEIFPRHVVDYMSRQHKESVQLERQGLRLLRHIQVGARARTGAAWGAVAVCASRGGRVPLRRHTTAAAGAPATPCVFGTHNGSSRCTGNAAPAPPLAGICCASALWRSSPRHPPCLPPSLRSTRTDRTGPGLLFPRC